MTWANELVFKAALGQVPPAPPEPEAKPATSFAVTKVDDHFAPSAEQLDVEYNIKHLASEVVTFQIVATNDPARIIFERELTEAEKSDGTGKPLTWDGKVNAGARKDRYATPLQGPFTARLTCQAQQSEKGFKILYHSIVLGWGKHTPDGALPPETEKTKYVQAKLDELGYDAGPVDGRLGKVTVNAVKRFQRANYKEGTHIRLRVTGVADRNTIAAMKKATPRQVWEDGKDPLKQHAKFYVYDNFMNDPEMDFVAGIAAEFNSQDRKKHAEDKMERPYLPLEVEVQLLKKDGTGVSAPDAVGAVPVAWEMSDPPEDAAVVPAAKNPKARTYLTHARQIGRGAASGAGTPAAVAVAGAPRIDQNGDNALDRFQGYRGNGLDYPRSLFPADSGSRLAPYRVERYASETRDGRKFHQAIVCAWDHATDEEKCKGRAGVYFRFSNKGGDNGKVRVSLRFLDLPNGKQLADDHKAAKVTLFKETGVWTVWRRSRISAYCAQTHPSRPSGLPTWTEIRDIYKQAFIELENDGHPLQVLHYAKVVPEAVYKKAILAMPSHYWPDPNLTAASLHYHASSMYGGTALAQNPAESAAAYVSRVSNAAKTWIVNPVNAILKVIHDHARRTSPEGFVIFDYRVHEPVTGQDWDPALNGGAGGFKPSPNASVHNQVSPVAGYVRCSGAVTMNVDNPYNVNTYVAHECGHARFLYHHETQNNGVSDNPNLHNDTQRDCTMSYLVAPTPGPDAYRYFFCGKCLLRLRGWDVLALPNKYT